MLSFDKNCSIGLRSYLIGCASNYQRFMGGEGLPDIRCVAMSAQEAALAGAWARVTHIDGLYTMRVFDRINLPAFHGDFILYHELTHAYDIHSLCDDDKMLHASLMGFLEYHASQIELLELLHSPSINETITFSMQSSVHPYLDMKPLIEHLRAERETVTQGIRDCLASPSIQLLHHVVNSSFNQLGRVSVCRMHATDYALYRDELEDNSMERSFFGEEEWRSMTEGFGGYLSSESVSVAANNFLPAFMNTAKRYGIRPA